MPSSLSDDFKVLKFRFEDLEKNFKILSEKVDILRGIVENLSGNNTQQQSSSSPYYNDDMQTRQNIPQRQQGKTKQGGFFAQNYAAEAAKATAQSSYGNSPQAPTGAAAQAFFLRFPFTIQRDPNDPEKTYFYNTSKLPNLLNFGQFLGYNMPTAAISTDEETGCGVFYYNTANPSQTLEAYVQYRIQKYMDESKKKQEEEENLRRRQEEEARIQAEEARKKQEEDDRRRKQAEEKAKNAAKKKIFDLVRNERNKPNARYLQLNPDGRSFSYSSSSGSNYIMLVDKNGTRAALPNQVDPFDSSMISKSVYSCNTDYVEDDSICRRYCIIDEDYKILQQGIIEA